MNLTPEVLLGIITAVAVTLTSTIGFLAKLMLAELAANKKLMADELAECKTDREGQTEKITELHVQLFDLSRQIGRMEKHFEHIDKRNAKIDDV